MTYYIYIKNNVIYGKGQAKLLNEDILNIEVHEEIYNEVEKYTWNGMNLIPDPEYEIKQIQKERERLDMLSLTAADVERAIYKAGGMDFEDILELVKLKGGMDIKALKIELKANNFYRGNPYIEAVGALLGLTPKMLDEFFETGDWTKLTEGKNGNEIN